MFLPRCTDAIIPRYFLGCEKQKRWQQEFRICSGLIDFCGTIILRLNLDSNLPELSPEQTSYLRNVEMVGNCYSYGSVKTWKTSTKSETLCTRSVREFECEFGSVSTPILLRLQKQFKDEEEQIHAGVESASRRGRSGGKCSETGSCSDQLAHSPSSTSTNATVVAGSCIFVR